MKTCVIYDSFYGNTEKIAAAVARALAPRGEVMLIKAGAAAGLDLFQCDFLIFGSPTHGGRPTPAFGEFFKKIPDGALENKNVAVFDTRLAENGRSFMLRLLMKVIKYAAPKMAGILKKKGGNLAAEPEGFVVEGKEGPLKQGELERAAEWAKGILR